MARRRGDAILLAEANLPPPDQRRFFGDEDGDEMHMVFNFVANQRMFLSLVRQDAGPLADALAEAPAIPETGQWASFVKNHDELSLDKLGEGEREEVFAALAPDEDMRIYGRGIRRRVPPMLGGDRRRLELVYSLLFALPHRSCCMARSWGWATTWPWRARQRPRGHAVERRPRLRLPPRPGPGAGRARRRVRLRAGQRRRPAARPGVAPQLDGAAGPDPQGDPGAGLGPFAVLPAGDPAVLALRRLAGLGGADRPQPGRPARRGPAGRADLDAEPAELLADQAYEPLAWPAGGVPVGAYGYRWFRLRG